MTAAVVWGSSFAVSKVAMQAVDAWHLTVIRYGIALLCFAGWLLYAEGPGALRCEGRAGTVLALGIVGIGGGVLLMFVGLQRARAEHAGVIVATQPLVAALLGWAFRGQRPTPRTMLAIALALSGVALVVTRGDPRTLLEGESAIGDMMMLGAATCWATYTLSAAAFPAWSSLRYTTLTVAAGALFCVSATIIAVVLGVASTPAVAQLRSVGWEIAYVTFCSAMLGTLCWNIGIRKIGAGGVLFINFVPITAFLIGVAQGYRFNWAELLGAVLVVSALLVNRIAASR
jgi:drug/metabolite transporter (DMT)-like permease